MMVDLSATIRLSETHTLHNSIYICILYPLMQNYVERRSLIYKNITTPHL